MLTLFGVLHVFTTILLSIIRMFVLVWAWDYIICHMKSYNSSAGLPKYFTKKISLKTECGVIGVDGQTARQTELKVGTAFATIPLRSLEEEIALEITPKTQLVTSTVEARTILPIWFNKKVAVI
jgi:hypothetical protein